LADTEFKIFAKLLATKYRRNRKVEVFAQELFEKIYLPESEDDPVDETLPRTYKAYYYGQNDITELASKISKSLDHKAPSKNSVSIRPPVFIIVNFIQITI